MVAKEEREHEIHEHWADKLAGQIIERSRKEKRTPNIKCQQTPSGGKSIGNANDVIRAYFPYKAILERGGKAEFVHTSDDRDPMKETPKRLADLDGKWHDSKELVDFSKYTGVPYFLIPDPFGCCKSWSKHFTKVWMDGLAAVGIEPALYYLDNQYREERMRPYVRKVLEKVALAKEIAGKFQETKRTKEYIPFDGICPNCHKLSQISSFDLKAWTAHFTCGGKALKKKRSEGCGAEAEVSLDSGKLPWRFEWPALWGLFHTTFEPFGKDHAEGSWPQGQEVARKIFGIEPPIPFVYEFFLVSGEKMSASKGNVYIVQDMMRIMETGPFLLFYAKKAMKQRNFDLKNAYTMVDEFDKAERAYFGTRDHTAEHIEENYKRMYELTMQKIPEEAPNRVPYNFCSFIAQVTDNRKRREEIISNYLGKEASKTDLENALKRISLAGYWVKNYASEEHRIKLLDEITYAKVDTRIIKIWKEAADLIERGISGERLQEFFYKAADGYGIEKGELFSATYKLFLGKEKGPRLGYFLVSLDGEFVVERLRMKK